MDTVIFVEDSVGVTLSVVRRLSIGWNFDGIGIGVIVGSLHALHRVGDDAVGDFAAAVGAGDGVDLFLRSGEDLHCHYGLILALVNPGRTKGHWRRCTIGGRGCVVIVARRQRRLMARHVTCLNEHHVGTLVVGT